MNDWVNDYYIFKLVPTLKELGAGELETTRLIPWFREAAAKWVGQFATEQEFATYTRTRIRIKLNQTQIKNSSIAMKVIESLFSTDEDDLELQDVLDAVALIVPAKQMPFKIQMNGDVVLIDLEPAILKVDRQFFTDILIPLYPFETVKKDVIKKLPLGLGVERIVRLFDLACWYRFRGATREERAKYCALHSADTLDWTKENLYVRDVGLSQRMALIDDNRPIATAASLRDNHSPTQGVRPLHVTESAKSVYAHRSPAWGELFENIALEPTE